MLWWHFLSDINNYRTSQLSYTLLYYTYQDECNGLIKNVFRFSVHFTLSKFAQKRGLIFITPYEIENLWFIHAIYVWLYHYCYFSLSFVFDFVVYRNAHHVTLVVGVCGYTSVYTWIKQGCKIQLVSFVLMIHIYMKI